MTNLCHGFLLFSRNAVTSGSGLRPCYYTEDMLLNSVIRMKEIIVQFFTFKRAVILALLAVLVLSSLLSSQAQEILPLPGTETRAYTEVQQLSLTDAVTGDNFGRSLAIYDDTLLVGAPFRNGNTGAVYVYQRDAVGTWALVDELVISNGEVGDWFGSEVVLQGDMALISAPGDGDDYIGIVYVFVRDGSGGWELSQKLKTPQQTSGPVTIFGQHIAMSGQNLAISGSLNATPYGPVVFVYHLDTDQRWQYEAELLPDVWPNDDTAALEPLPQVAGSTSLSAMRYTIAPGILAIELEGDTLMVGYQYQNGSLSQTNIYQRSAGQWTLAQGINVDSTIAECDFGRAMDIFNAHAFIAAQRTCSLLYPRPGVVFAYEKSAGGEWMQTHELLPDDTNATDDFGASLAFDGVTLVVGSPGDSERAGAVYLFGWDGSAWVQQEKLIAEGGSFGQSLVAERGTFVASAPEYDGIKGKAYVYHDPDFSLGELLTDGGFEQRSFKQDASGWTVKNPTGDKVKCDPDASGLAYEGACAFRFKGRPGENAKLEQELVSGVLPGDTVTLSGYVNASGAVDSTVKVVVTSLDPSVENTKLIVEVTSATGGYVPLSWFQSILTTNVAEPVKKVKVSVKNSSESGKVYYDALSLTVQ